MTYQYQLLPDLSQSEYEALKNDIRERGVLVPIELDDKGAILDGHHRLQAWRELRAEGVSIPDYPRMIRAGMSEVEKRNHIRALNILRRHLSKEQQCEQWEAMRADGMTYQAIAEVSGVSDVTVMQAVTKNLVTQPSHVTGKDGKRYPARKNHKPKTVMAKNKREANAVFGALANMPADELPDTIMDAKRVARLRREFHAEEKRNGQHESELHIGSASLLLGDFRERGLEIQDTLVDLILTDPPYSEEYLPLWYDLSRFASRVLKPEGMLIAYTGAMYLPAVMAGLGEYMRYWWAGSIVLDGPHSRVHARSVAQGSKPLLFFVRNDFSKPFDWFEDTFRSEGEQKENHDWQQSLGAAVYYISRLTAPDALVVDPCLGGGTTAVGALETGRNFIGIEIDPVAYKESEERLQKWTIARKT